MTNEEEKQRFLNESASLTGLPDTARKIVTPTLDKPPEHIQGRQKPLIPGTSPSDYPKEKLKPTSYENPTTDKSVEKDEGIVSPEIQVLKDKKEDNSHPILKELENSFGLKSIAPVTIKLNNIEFTLRPITNDLIAYSSRYADNTSLSSEEQMIRLKISLASCCVSHIKGIPVYEIFDIRKEDGENIKDESYPPSRIMKECARVMIDWMTNETRMSLAEMIFRAYNRELDEKTRVDETTELIENDNDLSNIENILTRVVKIIPEEEAKNFDMETLNDLRKVSRYANPELKMRLLENLTEWLGRNIPENYGEQPWLLEILDMLN